MSLANEKCGLSNLLPALPIQNAHIGTRRRHRDAEKAHIFEVTGGRLRRRVVREAQPGEAAELTAKGFTRSGVRMEHATSICWCAASQRRAPISSSPRDYMSPCLRPRADELVTAEL